jgi:hypothetical protein
VLSALDVTADQPHRLGAVAAPQQCDELAVLIIRVAQKHRWVRDSRDQLAHLALHLGHRPHKPWRGSGLRDSDVEPDVRSAVDGEVMHFHHRVGEHVEPIELLSRATLGSEQRRSKLDRDPEVQHGPSVLSERGLVGLGKRRPLGYEGSAATTAKRNKQAALNKRRKRLSQGRAGDRQLVGERALGRESAAGRQDSGADRGSEPLDRLLESGSRPNGLEHSLKNSVLLHDRNGTAIPR